MSRSRFVLSLFLTAVLAMPALARSPSPEGAYVYIISPANGEMVSSPVTVRFGLSGMGVAPAGVDRPDTGHHHLLIDVSSPPTMDRPLPSDAHHRHFGGGQTQVSVDLKPGKHTLQLMLGDKDHVPHFPPVMSAPVTIFVR